MSDAADTSPYLCGACSVGGLLPVTAEQAATLDPRRAVVVCERCAELVASGRCAGPLPSFAIASCDDPRDCYRCVGRSGDRTRAKFCANCRARVARGARPETADAAIGPEPRPTRFYARGHFFF